MTPKMQRFPPPNALSNLFPSQMLIRKCDDAPDIPFILGLFLQNPKLSLPDSFPTFIGVNMLYCFHTPHRAPAKSDSSMSQRCPNPRTEGEYHECLKQDIHLLGPGHSSSGRTRSFGSLIPTQSLIHPFTSNFHPT